VGTGDEVLELGVTVEDEVVAVEVVGETVSSDIVGTGDEVLELGVTVEDEVVAVEVVGGTTAETESAMVEIGENIRKMSIKLAKRIVSLNFGNKIRGSPKLLFLHWGHYYQNE